MKIKNIYVETYGCTASLNDSEIMKGILSRKGFNIVENEKIADIVILNTCVVKGPTIKRMESRIKHFSNFNKRFIVTGCMPEVLSDKIKKLATKASMISTHHIKEIAKVVKSVLDGKRRKRIEIIGKSRIPKLCLSRIYKNKLIGITQLSQGCSGNCSYCLVKLVKGYIFSYPRELILKDVRQNLIAGCKEIWLTSQDNAAYGLDYGKNELPELLKKILSLKGKFFIRLGMMNPSSVLPITDKLIECYKNKKMFKFLHLPVQSGSNKILKLMNREYKAEDFIYIVKKFRKEFPNLTLSTDIIYGFPGERKKDFVQTIKLVEKVKPDILNISRFWPMPGTKAALMEKTKIKKPKTEEKTKTEKTTLKVSLEDLKKRANALMELHKKIALSINKKFLGNRIKMIVDSKGFDNTLLGRAENYKLVAVPTYNRKDSKNHSKNLLGKIIDVKIKKVLSHYLIGELEY